MTPTAVIVCGDTQHTPYDPLGDNWQTTTCGSCGTDVWISAKGRHLNLNHRYPVWCGLCAKLRLPPDATLHQL